MGFLRRLFGVRTLFTAVLAVAGQRFKENVAKSSNLNDAEKAVAAEVIDEFLAELAKELDEQS